MFRKIARRKKVEESKLEKACRRLRENDPALQQLYLGLEHVDDDGAKALADALSDDSTLQALNLQLNQIGDDGAKDLADALERSKTLQKLYLEYNEIGDDGAKALADALLKSNSKLQELYFDNNQIGDVGAKALADALTSNSTLKLLKICDNRIGDVGAKALADALKSNITLHYLDLDKNEIGDDGAQALLQMLEKHNGTLSCLRFHQNSASDSLKIAALTEANKKNTRNPPPQPLPSRISLEQQRREQEAAEVKRREEEAAEQRRREQEVAEQQRRVREAAEHQRREQEIAEQRRRQQEAANLEQGFGTPAVRQGGPLDDIRKQLHMTLEKKRRDPVEVSIEYLNLITMKKELGRGVFGVVYKGVDRVLGKDFAVKKVDPQVLENASASRIDCIQSSFQNEMKILRMLEHPNIAKLYGYCLDLNNPEGNCLLFELAVNGSLDNFWKNDHGRRRLSSARSRIKIAYEVAMVLRYMHEGLNWEAVCFHRDIKSANVCVAANFSARVIDCGLSKYVVDGRGSTTLGGALGTRGYICPDYSGGDIPYQSACDVFSFGVLLCELITGRASKDGNHHFTVYVKHGRRQLQNDVDCFVEWENERASQGLVKLSLECMNAAYAQRPTIGDVVERLHELLCLESREEPSGQAVGHGNKCRECGRISIKTISCHGTEQHTHCGSCMERRLVHSIAIGEPHLFCCLKEDCDSRNFTLLEVADCISTSLLADYNRSQETVLRMQSLKQDIQRALQLIPVIQSALAGTNERVDTSLRLQAQLCAGNGLPCPHRFILVEADKNGVRPWRHPREWFNNVTTIKLYLYFVCSYSNQLVSDNHRIKLRYTKDDLRRIAPAYNLSLSLLESSSRLIGHEFSLERFQLKEADEWVNDLLTPNDREILARARRKGGHVNSGEAQKLIGPALSLVAEKAAEKKNLGWHSELTQAFDFEKKQATFIHRHYIHEPRFSQWQGA